MNKSKIDEGKLTIRERKEISLSDLYKTIPRQGTTRSHQVPLTVKDFIDLLKTYPQEATVEYGSSGYYGDDPHLELIVERQETDAERNERISEAVRREQIKLREAQEKADAKRKAKEAEKALELEELRRLMKKYNIKENE